MVGYKDLPFRALSGNFWWAVGILGPHFGAILGALSYEYLRRVRTEYHQNNLPLEINSKVSVTAGNFDSNNNTINF